MSRDLERAVKRAQKRLAQDYGSIDAWANLHSAERQLAAARHQAWAEPLDLGVMLDAGAPLPHVVSNGSSALLVCHAAVVDPHWDGTYVNVVSPTDQTPTDMLEFTFAGCHAVKIGGPNERSRFVSMRPARPRSWRCSWQWCVTEGRALRPRLQKP